jgi:hypothetical protein
MHIHTLRQWQHRHDFSAIHHGGESRTIRVPVLAFITMGVDIIAGNIFGLNWIDPVVTHYPKPPEHYKRLLKDLKELDHITIEINPCLEPPCLPET